MPRTATFQGRALVWTGVLIVALIAASVLSLMVGARPLDPIVVIQAVFDRDLSLPDHAVVWDGRIPRTALAIVAGSAIGAAGALIQGLTRNSLADPGILGVNAGAAFCVVIAVTVFGISSLSGYIWFAFAGAIGASVLVFSIGRTGAAADPIRLVLAGVALSAVLEGIGQGLALLDPQAFDRLRTWNVGSVDIGSIEPVIAVSGFVALGLAVAAYCARGLNAIALGEDAAASLGVSLRATRIATVLAVALLAGSAAATAGVIVFLGLMVPHLVRRITGPDNRWVIALSALMAPVIFLLADVVGRLILPGELAAGIVVAFIGAPFFIALAVRRRVISL